MHACGHIIVCVPIVCIWPCTQCVHTQSVYLHMQLLDVVCVHQSAMKAEIWSVPRKLVQRTFLAGRIDRYFLTRRAAPAGLPAC